VKLTKIVLWLVVLGVVAVGAFVFWFAVIRDDDPLEAKLPETSSTVAPSTEPGATTTSGAPSDAGVEGVWTLQPGDGEELFVGYNIEETLRGLDATATGTTGTYEGALTIEGASVTALGVTIDMTTLESDEGFRDDSIRDEGIESDTFRTATFTLAAPIELPGEPVPGEEIAVPATGDLTLHGVTKAVSFEVKGRFNGDSIDVTGTIPVVLADYGITAPSRGFVSVRGEGEIVFVLRFAR